MGEEGRKEEEEGEGMSWCKKKTEYERETSDGSSEVGWSEVGLGRDIGGEAVILYAEEAEYITGQRRDIDGGILANQMNWDESLL